MTDPTPPSPPPLRLPTDRTTGEESVVEARLRRMIAEAEQHRHEVEQSLIARSSLLDQQAAQRLLHRHAHASSLEVAFFWASAFRRAACLRVRSWQRGPRPTSS